jgi:hypothetical protein
MIDTIVGLCFIFLGIFLLLEAVSIQWGIEFSDKTLCFAFSILFFNLGVLLLKNK